MAGTRGIRRGAAKGSARRAPSGEHRNRADVVVDELGRAILTGELAPGALLPSERELEVDLGLNRTTIREGLSQLEQLGLIDRRHGARCRVLDFRRSGSMDLLPLMARFGMIDLGLVVGEVAATIYESVASLAARRARGTGARPLVQAAEALAAAVDAGDGAAALALDREFHHTVATATGSIAFELMMSSFYRTADALDVDGAWSDLAASALLALGKRQEPIPHLLLAAAIADGDEAGAQVAAVALAAEVSRRQRRVLARRASRG